MIKFRVDWLNRLGQWREVALIQNRLHKLEILASVTRPTAYTASCRDPEETATPT